MRVRKPETGEKLTETKAKMLFSSTIIDMGIVKKEDKSRNEKRKLKPFTFLQTK